jgi:tetratricopeptide (TPR) repeat protein
VELLIVLGAWIILQRHISVLEGAAPAALAPRKIDPQIAQLTSYADRLYTERKWLAAEKAYLNVLKLDHKNFKSYLHLGIIYSTQKNLPDAIECFQIATRLHPSGGTYQNLALAYYDNRNYIKSIAAYERAIALEPNAQRYVGIGKAHLKLHNLVASAEAFEKAVELDPSRRNLERLAAVYDEAGRKDDLAAVTERIHNLNAPHAATAPTAGIVMPDSASTLNPEA